MLSRRSFGAHLAGLGISTALLTSACDDGEPLDLPGLPAGDDEPDLDQVLAGLRHEQEALDAVMAVRRRHRSLRRALAPTAAVHRAHVELLSRAVEDPPGSAGADSGGRPPADPVEAVADLIRLELTLADRHVTTAMRSRSGVLARVVATMSAAAAQQATVLTPLSVPEQGGAL